MDKINASAILIYVNMIKGNTLDASIDLYHLKTIEEISTELENLHYSDIYNLEEKDAYVMLFENKKVYIEFPYENDYFNDSITYEDANLNGFKIIDVESLQDFSQTFTVALGRRYAKNAGIVYLGNSLIYTIVFPLMLSLIVWLGLRKRGCLKRFREYYNVLAIVSIVPCSISFILAWFISSTSGLVYLALIAIYGLMMLYQVTSLKE